MKWIFILLICGFSVGSFGDVYADLDQRVKSNLEEFKKKSTPEQFEEIQKDAQEMIRMNKQDYRGYSHLFRLYLDSKELIGLVEARERAVEIMNCYIDLDDFKGKVDFSDVVTFLTPRIESAKKEAKRKEVLEKRVRRKLLSEMESVRKARELIRSYREQLSTVDLDKATTLGEMGQSTSLSQPLFSEKVSGMEGASPLKSGFFNSEFAVRSGVNSEPDFYDQKRVVTFRVLLFRPLQTGLTRHRFRASHERVRVPLSSASLKRGTERPGCILTLAIACA